MQYPSVSHQRWERSIGHFGSSPGAAGLILAQLFASVFAAALVMALVGTPLGRRSTLQILWNG